VKEEYAVGWLLVARRRRGELIVCCFSGVCC
jgi:hypothetical protein